MKTPPHIARRSFLKQLGLAGLAAPFVTRGLMAVPPSSVLGDASFGTAGLAECRPRPLPGHKVGKPGRARQGGPPRLGGLKKEIRQVHLYQDRRSLRAK